MISRIMIGVSAVEMIGAGAAGQIVIVCPAIEPVVAQAAKKIVVSRISVDMVDRGIGRFLTGKISGQDVVCATSINVLSSAPARSELDHERSSIILRRSVHHR
jgi:hypothetical protein